MFRRCTLAAIVLASAVTSAISVEIVYQDQSGDHRVSTGVMSQRMHAKEGDLNSPITVIGEVLETKMVYVGLNRRTQVRLKVTEVVAGNYSGAEVEFLASNSFADSRPGWVEVDFEPWVVAGDYIIAVVHYEPKFDSLRLVYTSFVQNLDRLTDDVAVYQQTSTEISDIEFYNARLVDPSADGYDYLTIYRTRVSNLGDELESVKRSGGEEER